MTRRIRKGHTLAVAVACLKEAPHRNPRLIEELEKIAAEYQGRDRTFDAHQERNRIERQRTLFNALPDCRAVAVLKQAMLDRAWALLDSGECAACDALLEFLPSKDAEKLLDVFFAEEEDSAACR